MGYLGYLNDNSEVLPAPYNPQIPCFYNSAIGSSWDNMLHQYLGLDKPAGVKRKGIMVCPSDRTANPTGTKEKRSYCAIGYPYVNGELQDLLGGGTWPYISHAMNGLLKGGLLPSDIFLVTELHHVDNYRGNNWMSYTYYDQMAAAIPSWNGTLIPELGGLHLNSAGIGRQSYLYLDGHIAMRSRNQVLTAPDIWGWYP
jgi:hypothetical protein